MIHASFCWRSGTPAALKDGVSNQQEILMNTFEHITFMDSAKCCGF
jgi:hypothetical protein